MLGFFFALACPPGAEALAVPMAHGLHLARSLTSQSAAAAAAGGSILGLVAARKLRVNGDVLGISGIAGGLTKPHLGKAEALDRASFVLGLVAAGSVLRRAAPACLGGALPVGPRLALAGLLVGYGTARGSGCTSGHGICGNSRLSQRSMAATVVFMLAGFATATAFQTAAWCGGAPPSPISRAPALALALAAAFAAAEKVLLASAKKTTKRRFDALCGLVFGLALGLAGMTSPQRVAAFLDLSQRAFDPTLAFVMAGAIGIAAPLGALRLPAQPKLGGTFNVPPRTKPVDVSLLIGSVIFGCGWGLGGACPGPALVVLGAATNAATRQSAMLFTASMFLGWAAHHRKPLAALR